MKEKTIAQEALELLSPIPNNKWCVGEYISADGKMCALAHYAHLKNPSIIIESHLQFCRHGPLNDSIEDLDNITREFLRKEERMFSSSLADINNGEIKSYKQRGPRARTIAILKDMIKAGY